MSTDWLGDVTERSRRLSVGPDGEVKGKTFLQDVKEKVQNAALTSIQADTFGVNFTVEQRYSMLQKKISEYRTMLNTAVNGDGVKSLMDLFLTNISKELSEIHAEYSKTKTYPPYQPQFPALPTMPSYPPYSPGIIYGGPNDGVCGPLEMQKRTVCAGQTCVDYVAPFLINNNEENS